MTQEPLKSLVLQHPWQLDSGEASLQLACDIRSNTAPRGRTTGAHMGKRGIRRKANSAVTLTSVALLLATTATGFTSANAAEDSGSLVEVPQLADPSAPPAPLSLRQRLPEKAKSGATLGLASVDTGTPSIAGASVDNITSDLMQADALSGSNYDVYTDPTTGGSHVAVVYTGDLNERAAGSWRASDGPLATTSTGYTARRSGNAKITFPLSLSSDSPVTFAVGTGSMTMVPVGVRPTTGIKNEDSVTYPDALAATDIKEAATPGGFKESLILKDSSAPTTITWQLGTNGLGLDNSSKDVAITAGNSVVARMPIAFITDSAGRSIRQPLTLDRQSLTLTLALDPTFLAEANYPITIDPGASTLSASRDTYTDSGTPSTSYETATNMYARYSGPTQYSWVNFDTSGLTNSSRLVYAADLKLKNVSGTSTTTVRQVTAAWPGTMTYSNQPSVAANDTASASGAAGATWTWNVASLYQRYIEGSWTNYGMRLVNLSTSNATRFYTKETGNSANRPSLVLSYNDLPGVPTLSSPEGALTSDAPVLHATAIPSDPNSDPVLLQFQVALCPSGNCASADFSNPTWTSNYLDTPSAQVTAGILQAGNTYTWRAVARDVCSGTSTLCSLTDGAGVVHAAPTSLTKIFQIAPTNLGRDDRYEMWAHDMGSGMSGAVNIANGNFNLNVPFDTLSTRLGGVTYGLNYDSLSTKASDLGTGWSLYATPDGIDTPVSLEDRSTSDSIVITTASGEATTFVQAGASLYLSSGAGIGAGRVTHNNNGTFTYIPSEGGKVVFNSSGWPINVRAPQTTSDQGAAGGVLTYAYSGSHLTSVTDPDGRAITFTWTANALDRVTAQDGRIFEVTQTPTSLSFVDPTNRSVGIVRDASSRPTEIRDGAVIAHSGTGWVVAYNADSTVSQITAPPGGAPTSPSPWVFTRTGPFFGQNASVGTVTDPRGSVPTTFTKQVDFNTRGLPIRVAGPADQNGYWPIEIKSWDSNGNLVCVRGPAANAIYEKTPTNCSVDEQIDPIDDKPTMSATSTYEPYAPYRVTQTLEGVQSGTQPQVDQAYVSGNGLNFSHYASLNLDAIARKEGIRLQMSADYGSGAPTGVTGGDNWSIRYEGSLDVSPGTYRFRFFTNDGVTVVAGTSVLAACFGEQKSSNHYNCGSDQDAVLTVATAGRIPFTVFYSELTGNADYNLKWDAGTGGAFSTIPASVIHPLSAPQGAHTGAKIDDGSGGVRPVRTPTYANDDETLTGLPSSVTTAGGGATTTTTHGYDAYGRSMNMTIASGTGASATTSYTYGQTQCFLTQSGPDSGATITQTCNARGQATQRTVSVRAVNTQPSQSRVTDYTYDDMGRLLTEDPPGAAYITHTYDGAGRELSSDELLATGVHKITTNAYDDAGHLLSVGSTDAGTVNYTYDWADNQLTQSDPRNATWKTTSTYDAQNREISSTSPSGLVTATVYTLSASTNTEAVTEPNGVTTTTTYDVKGNVISEKTGSLNATTYTYDDEGNQTKLTDPSGAETLTQRDALTNEKVTKTTLPGGTYATTTSTFDAAGNLASIDGPRSGSDQVYFTWDDAGNLLAVQQAGLATPNTTTYTYDDADELVKVDQPMVTGTSFIRSFTYDTAGNQVSATDARGTVTSTYDAGGRLITESLPNGVSKTHTYDAQGRELSVTATKSGFASATRSFIYDLAGNMTKATQGSKVIDLTYDSESRLTQVSTDAGDTSTAAFNASTGKQSSLTTVAGAMNYTWNSNGLLSTVQDPFTSQSTTYTWDNSGRITGRSDPASLTWTRTYDEADRVDTQTIVKSGTTLASFDLDYDAAGNVTSRAEIVKTPSGTNLSGSGTWTYGYDAAGRMTSATDPSSVQTTYGYDRAGNRTSVQVGAGPVVTTTYDSASLPTSSSDGLTYAYDAMGTLTSVDKSGGSTGDQCFAYDQFGLLASFKANSTTGCGQGTGDVQYAYDALGRTVSRTGAMTTTSNFILDGEDLARTTTGGTATLYAFSPEGLMASSTGGSARFFLKDLHGDTVGAVNASGSVMGSKLYSPWGETAASAGETYSAGFQSQPTDADTGYVDMTTRLYSPTQGRFSSRDVLFGDTQSPASMNQYGFAEGSPVTMSDPTGMYVCQKFLNSNLVMTRYHCNSKDAGPGAGIVEQADIYIDGGGYSPARIHWQGFLKVTKLSYSTKWHWNLYVQLTNQSRKDRGAGPLSKCHEIFDYNDIKDKDWHQGCPGNPLRGVDAGEYSEHIPYYTETKLLYGEPDGYQHNLGWVRVKRG